MSAARGELVGYVASVDAQPERCRLWLAEQPDSPVDEWEELVALPEPPEHEGYNACSELASGHDDRERRFRVRYSGGEFRLIRVE